MGRPLSEAARWIATVPTPDNGLGDFHSPRMMAADAEPHRLLTEQPIVLAMLEPEHAGALADTLQEGGFLQVLRLDGSAAFLDSVRRCQPALVFIDLSRTVEPGLERLGALRRDEQFRSLPVVALVARDDALARRLALEGGASDVLCTPVDPSEVAMRVRNSLVLRVFEERVASIDPVTGLPNRRVFLERLRTSLARLDRSTGVLALLQVSLDRFDAVAASLGHTAAEHLVSRVARRLRSCVRRDEDELRLGRIDSVLICRLEPDAFAILLPSMEDPGSAARVARRVLNTLSRPLRIGLDDVSISPSVGIAVAPHDGDVADALVAAADHAARHAQQMGRSTFRYHATRLNQASIERLKLETHLLGARKRRELRLLFQPKIDRRSGRISGAEALLRWQPSGLPRLGPDRFLPIAEESGLIVEFGEWVLDEACAQLARWHAQGLGPLKVSVNLSARELAAPGIVDWVGQCIERHGLGRHALCLEISERVLSDRPDRHAMVLEALRRLGVDLAVGEFGLGDTSLSDLRHLSVDEIKIDRAFTAGLPQAHADLGIVRAIVVLAQSQGIRVVAEGIEHPEQLRAVRELGIDEFQGYMLGHPMRAEAFAGLVGPFELDAASDAQTPAPPGLA